MELYFSKTSSHVNYIIKIITIHFIQQKSNGKKGQSMKKSAHQSGKTYIAAEYTSFLADNLSTQIHSCALNLFLLYCLSLSSY